MNTANTADRVTVLDAEGRELSPTSIEKARRLLAAGRATLVSETPFVVRLSYTVHLPPKPEPAEERPIGEGKSILLHVCCAPCGTYTVERLRELGFAVTGFWYNPNIHPWSEHERRRETLARYATEVDLPMIWAEGYEMPSFLRAVAGRRHHHHPAHQPLSEPGANPAHWGNGRSGAWRDLLLRELPAGMGPAGTPGPRVRSVSAAVLRLRVQRVGGR